MDIVLASNNKHKLKEVRDILSEYNVLSLHQIGFNSEIEETGATICENALIKAREIRKHTDKMIIADDTGLFVHALNDEPGVYSARYAGESATFEDNNNKMLKALENNDDRSAVFKCAIALSMSSGEEKIFLGQVNGQIAQEYCGAGGFGYDPIFIPDGMDKSYAELSSEEKDRLSHRAKAIGELKKYLESIKQATL